MVYIANVDLTIWTEYLGLDVMVYWKLPRESTVVYLFASYMG